MSCMPRGADNTGTGVWVDSGSLLGPDGATHNARAALDSAGGAILLALSSSGVYTSSNAGQFWWRLVARSKPP